MRDDDTLMRAFALGEREAAEDITALYLPPTYRLALRMVRNQAQAEDIAQEAMLKLWKYAANWQPGHARLSTWLHRVCMNLAVDHLRKVEAGPLDDAGSLADERPSALEYLMCQEEGEEIRAAVDALPERQRAAIHLSHFEGLSNPQTAEILETSIEAVESLLARARRQLKASLAPLRPETERDTT